MSDNTESAISGSCGHRECRPPDRRTEIPAACRYAPAVSRRTPTSRSMRLSDHPSRPSTSICSRLSSFKTFVIPAEGPHGPPTRQTSRSCPVMAGFQVIIGGRFWVITEASVPRSSGSPFIRSPPRDCHLHKFSDTPRLVRPRTGHLAIPDTHRLCTGASLPRSAAPSRPASCQSRSRDAIRSP